MRSNNLLSFCVIDDDTEFLLIMKSILEETAKQLNRSVNVDLYDTFQPSVNYMDYDILFLDIEMPDINGYEIARSIYSKTCCLVYISAIDSYSFSGYENHGYDFVRKSMLQYDTARVIKRFIFEKDPIITIPNEGHLCAVPFSSIIIIRVSGNYIQVITDRNMYRSRKTLKQFITENDLMRYFIRINRSELVNPSKITARNKTTIVLSNQESVYISRKYYPQAAYSLSLYNIEIS